MFVAKPVSQQWANSQPTVGRQVFWGALLHNYWIKFPLHGFELGFQHSKRMSHLLRLWMTKIVSICSLISWGGFKFKSSIDQSYQRYGAYYDKRKKKLDFHYQPRNKVEGARLLWFTNWYCFQVISLHCKTKAQLHWVTLCATCSTYLDPCKSAKNVVRQIICTNCHRTFKLYFS